MQTTNAAATTTMENALEPHGGASSKHVRIGLVSFCDGHHLPASTSPTAQGPCLSPAE
jgi:hypothetical protein